MLRYSVAVAHPRTGRGQRCFTTVNEHVGKKNTDDLNSVLIVMQIAEITAEEAEKRQCSEKAKLEEEKDDLLRQLKVSQFIVFVI